MASQTHPTISPSCQDVEAKLDTTTMAANAHPPTDLPLPSMSTPSWTSPRLSQSTSPFFTLSTTSRKLPTLLMITALLFLALTVPGAAASALSHPQHEPHTPSMSTALEKPALSESTEAIHMGLNRLQARVPIATPPGTSCPFTPDTDGRREYNCLLTGWQRCASGRWSPVAQLAEGTTCSPPGMSGDGSFCLVSTTGGHGSEDDRGNGGHGETQTQTQTQGITGASSWGGMVGPGEIGGPPGSWEWRNGAGVAGQGLGGKGMGWLVMGVAVGVVAVGRSLF